MTDNGVATAEIGAHGEDLAVEYLRAAGAEILARNWRSRCGELDVIARDGPAIAFIEVKTRRGRRTSGGLVYRHGSPAESVTFPKQARIRRLAAAWLSQRNAPWSPVRFDVIAISMCDGADPLIEHRKGVF